MELHAEGMVVTSKRSNFSRSSVTISIESPQPIDMALGVGIIIAPTMIIIASVTIAGQSQKLIAISTVAESPASF